MRPSLGERSISHVLDHFFESVKNPCFEPHPIKGIWTRRLHPLVLDSDSLTPERHSLTPGSTIEVKSRCYLIEEDTNSFKLKKIEDWIDKPGDSVSQKQYSVRLGDGKVIRAWNLALCPFTPSECSDLELNHTRPYPGFCVGDRFELVTTAVHAYGKKGSPPLIPNDASLFFEIEILSQKAVETVMDCIKIALSEKDKGNLNFKNGSLKEAELHYKCALEKLNFVFATSESQKDMISSIKLTCHNNRAACQLQLKNFTEAKQSCDKVLYLDPSNVKAFYRRARAHCEKHDFERAKRDIIRAIKIKPADLTLRNELEKIKQLEAADNEKLKLTYSNPKILS
ncbi:uncharacterized protein LOC126324476 [Schistocerca gregaria]|uniref:uncharacterized protein LOC126324476 n=1 Tax=Schistocerca gregaria TaxID=7010 RepID=UPI00211E18D1|nr:uncharacterized protein LOC126324476 [Schistocerca gregaria]